MLLLVRGTRLLVLPGQWLLPLLLPQLLLQLQLLLQQWLEVPVGTCRARAPDGLLQAGLQQLAALLLLPARCLLLLLPLLLQGVGVVLLVAAQLVKGEAVRVWGLGGCAGADTGQLPR
jgi:hypothetical protein